MFEEVLSYRNMVLELHSPGLKSRRGSPLMNHSQITEMNYSHTDVVKFFAKIRVLDIHIEAFVKTADLLKQFSPDHHERRCGGFHG